MKIFTTDEVVEFHQYFVVCEDGAVRYLHVEICEKTGLVEFVHDNVHGEETYRTYSPELIYTM